MSEELSKEILLELMYELRIDKHSLSVMADGKSPNRPGNVTLSREQIEKWRQEYPTIQLSQYTAKKIVEMELDWEEWS